jgi:hypothetical protein
MLQLKAGDDLALNELMTRSQQPLVAFILRHTGSRYRDNQLKIIKYNHLIANLLIFHTAAPLPWR